MFTFFDGQNPGSQATDDNAAPSKWSPIKACPGLLEQARRQKMHLLLLLIGKGCGWTAVLE